MPDVSGGVPASSTPVVARGDESEHTSPDIDDVNWPNFPRADDPDLWDFRTGLYLHGCAVSGRADITAEIAERWPRPPRRGTPYLWDENDWPRWLYQAQVMEVATADRQPWISTFPWCSSTGDLDHLLADCPTVRAAQRHGIRPAWGLGLLEVDGSDVCAWCRRVYWARTKRATKDAA